MIDSPGTVLAYTLVQAGPGGGNDCREVTARSWQCWQRATVTGLEVHSRVLR